IDRCLHSFDNLIAETKIITDDLTVDEVVSEIMRSAGLPVHEDQRSAIRRSWDRVMTLIKHIRH
ncbi:MAG: tunicamycin resistance protein, partial [Bacillota bacterium]